MKSATRKSKRGAPRDGDDGVTLMVSPFFRDMVNDLAKSRGVTVREFCDGRGAELLAPDYAPLLKAKLARVGG